MQAETSALDQQQLHRLLVVGRGLLSKLHLEEILARLLDTARELTGAQFAAIGILDESRTELARFVVRGIDADVHRAIGDLPRGRGVLGVLIDDPRPLRLSEVTDHPESYGFPTGHPPMKSFLGVPIMIRGRSWGNLYLTEKAGGGDFSDADEESIVVLSDWAAIAIENARLYEDLDSRRAELERAVRAFEATSTIAKALGTETDLDRVLELIVKRARALVHARGVLVLLASGDDLVIAAAAGQVTRAADRLAIADNRCGDVIKTGRPLRIDNVDLDGRLDSAQLGVPDASTALLVPMLYRGRSLGVLCAFDRTQHEAVFDVEDERVFAAFAASAATAVATARTVESDRLAAALSSAEDERRRWARELHDETLQSLGALKVLLSSALRTGDGEQLRASLSAAADQLSVEIENLRGLIAELRPASLDTLGLAPALRTLFESSASAAGFEIDVSIDFGEESARLAPELETAIYRVAQEAMTNVTKHADAGRVDVEVRRDDRCVMLRVRDDGVGFDPGEATSGFGLLGMRERVALAGGTISIEPAEPGSRLVASFPLGTP